MKHKVELVHNLMYKGCEPHWHCTQCDVYIPIHCYTKEELENMEDNNKEFVPIGLAGRVKCKVIGKVERVLKIKF